MEALLHKFPAINSKFKSNDSYINKDQYGMMCFMCGFFFKKNCDIDDIYPFFQLLHHLKSLNKIGQFQYEHIISSLYQDSSIIHKVNNLLDKLMYDEQIQILAQMKKICKIINQPNSNSTLQKNQTVELPERESELQNKKIQEEEEEFELNGKENLDGNYFQRMEKQHKQSLALAQMLQAEEQKFAKSVNLPEDDAVCEICYVGLYQQQFLPLDNCEHIFHKSCLAQAFKAQINDNNFPLKCANDECLNSQVKDSDIKLVLESELYQKYQSHTLKFYADMNGGSISWCPTADCKNMFFFEEDDQVRFQCAQCKKQYCLNCRVEWHKDMTCKQYKVSSTHNEEDDKFLEFVKGKKFKQCPKCKFWVEKNHGCDHMTCKCKFDFCYKCGGVFMKCECVAKMQAEVNRRRQMQQQRRKKKQERLEAKKKKLAEKKTKAVEELSPKPKRSRRK